MRPSNLNWWAAPLIKNTFYVLFHVDDHYTNKNQKVKDYLLFFRFFFVEAFIIIHKIMLLNIKVILLNNIIWNECKYTPYRTQNTNPMQYMIYIDNESPDTFLVMIDFIAWGKNAMVVQKPLAYPINSPTKLFIFFSLGYLHRIFLKYLV